MAFIMIKVTKAVPQKGYSLYLEFSDGKKGVFDTKPYLNKGIFKELKNESYFNLVKIAFGTVQWPHEQDFAPETLHSEVTQ